MVRSLQPALRGRRRLYQTGLVSDDDKLRAVAGTDNPADSQCDSRRVPAVHRKPLDITCGAYPQGLMLRHYRKKPRFYSNICMEYFAVSGAAFARLGNLLI